MTGFPRTFQERFRAWAVGMPKIQANHAITLTQAADYLDQLEKLLSESKRPHHVCDQDNWYSCPKSGECCDSFRANGPCDCGAEEWNAKIDALLFGVSPATTGPTP